jgi:hypothetical protein
LRPSSITDDSVGLPLRMGLVHLFIEDQSLVCGLPCAHLHPLESVSNSSFFDIPGNDQKDSFGKTEKFQ